jgi:PAS domain S-box-containing protein
MHKIGEDLERFLTPSKSLPSLYFTLDSTGRVLAVNPVGVQHLGYAVEDLLEQSIFSLFHLEDRARLQTEFIAFVQNPAQVVQGQFCLISKDSRTLSVNVTIQALQGTDSNTVFLLNCQGITVAGPSNTETASEYVYSFSDITKYQRTLRHNISDAYSELRLHKRIEEERRQAEEKLALRHRELLALHKISEIHLSNRSLKSAYQEIVEEISTATGFPTIAIELYDSSRQMMVFEGVKGIPLPPNTSVLEVPADQTFSGTVVRTRQPAIKFYAPQEVKTCDGNESLRQLGIRTFICMPMIANDRAIGTLSLAHPEVVELDDHFIQWLASLANYLAFLTERKRAEEALRQQKEVLETIFEHLPVMLAFFDPQNKLQWINRAWEETLGWKLEELQNLDFLAEFYPNPDYRQNIINFIQSATETWADFKTRVRDGRVIDTTWANVRLSDGSTIGIGQDITERKQAEEALRQRAEREQLIAGITQHIRQSLNLEEILSTTVAEVRQILQVDRVLVYRLSTDGTGSAVTEAVETDLPTVLGQTFPEKVFPYGFHQLYTQGRVCAISDLEQAELAPCLVEFLQQFQVRAKLVVPILQGEELWGLLIAHQCKSSRQWQHFEIDLLQQLAAQVAIAIQQSQLYKQTQYQVQREQMLNRVIQTIRKSLDLKTIFSTATAEIAQLLDADRAEIVQYLPERKIWLNVADYRKTSDLPSAVGVEIPDKGNKIAARLKRLKVVRINDITTWKDKIDPNIAQTFPGAWLLVPLHFNSSVWGSLTLVRNRQQPSQWQDWEVELTCAVADQVAIAIQQSELFRQIQRLNVDLERQVQSRTAQLQLAFEFEATLKRITDRVRDSLDVNQILQAAVQELAIGLGVICCNAGLYDLDEGTSTICYEYDTSGSPSQGHVTRMEEFAEIYAQILRGECFQFCLLLPNPIRGQVAMLTCPIFDDQGVIGDLWLVNHKYCGFHEQDIRLVRQVANQCAIAIRQARLYQASQAQIEELEKLNHLKDDFLSTVSHELRTPVCNIKMAAQMLEIVLKQTGLFDSEPSSAVRYFQILNEECQREINLINNLLDLSRLEAGTEPLMLTRIDPQIWISSIAEPFIERAREQQQDLQIDIPSTLPTLTTDLTDLERIITELLNNACKYTPPGGIITVSAQSTAHTLQLCVSNSGIEIPERELTHIFDKFYRVPNNDPWKHGGTGLGLALVKKLVEHLGGTIQVESAAAQTIFTLQFPLSN